MKNKHLYSNTYRNYLIGISLLVSALFFIVLGVAMIDDQNILKVDSPTKEAVIGNKVLYNEIDSTSTVQDVQNNDNYIYLSDIPYMDISYTTKDRIRIDENINRELISLIVNGKQKYFTKGLVLHANATLAYDLREYDYEYLSVYLGLDASQGSAGNGVRFEVHTSEDGVNWTLKDRVNNNAVFKGNAESYLLKYPIKDVKYIKFVVQDHGGNNTSDHATFANAMLIKGDVEIPEGPKVDYIKTVSEYDSLIKNFNNDDLSKEQELILLQRSFVNNAGYDLLQSLATMSSDYNNAISWLMNDVDNLRLYVIGGKPAGTYYRSMTVLSELYKNYRNDWDNAEVSAFGNKKGDVYKKMAIALSLTHSADVGLWMQPSHPSNKSNAVIRYALFKQMYDENKFVVSKTSDITPWFETYSVEEMRFVMNTALDDEEILWLHDYTQARIEAGTGTLAPHKYIAYIWPNYNNPVFHSADNKEYFDELFMGIFSKYGVTYSSEGNKVYKVWMNLRNKFDTGAVCGGISKTGVNIKAVHGIPATVVGQPGHAAIAYYTRNAQGKGYWALDNNVSGWTLSEKGERLLLGWGNDSHYRNSWNVPYLGMSQEALNRFDQYQKSTELLMIADLYSDNPAKKEEYLWKSLDELDFNLDAWYGLVDLYINDDTKTDNDLMDLAEKMGDKLMKYPLAFFDLMKLIKPKLTEPAYQFKYSLLLTSVLNQAKVYNGTEIVNSSLTRTEANYLLGQVDSTLSTFSFDGEDAGKIVLSNRFDGTGVRWDYSLDGKATWHEVNFDANEEHKWQLTPEEIASITSANDIYIHIVGVNYSDENLYKIDILESLGIPSTVYANDLENKMMGTTSTEEWKLNENDEWKSFTDSTPDLTGDKDIMVRVRATGVRLASTNYVTYHFTQDVESPTRKYIPINHLSIESVSSEATAQGRPAINIIDGNANTSWHSDWNGADTTKEIVIKLDKIRNLTSIEYIPLTGANGKILSAQILVSVDGENWTEVISETNWTYANNNDMSMKTLDFDPVKAQYIKVVGKKTTTNTSGKSYMGGSMFNFYENTTVTIVGTFSFDGQKAGKIILDSDYKDRRWKYSLDGGITWKNGSGDEHLLTENEINQISVDNQIKIRFDGHDTQYTIIINKMDQPTLTPYLNDWENRLIGMPNNISHLEWKIEGTNNWTDYSEEEPVVEGTKKLYIRQKASSNCTASDPVEYQFTENNTSTAKYIPIKHLAVEGVSSQSVDANRPYYAPNAIDGNPNTIWHTDFRYSIAGTRASYTIKLDRKKYISALEYIQKKYKSDDPIFIRNMYVYVSENGQDWFEAGRLVNIAQTEELRRIDFEESIVGQYVKIEMEGYGLFASLSMVNLYEDTTRKKAGSFSFDGEDANKIILEDDLKAPNWEYSLDGGNTWKNATSDEHTLTTEEVDQVNGDDNIKLRINDKEYVIDIRNSETPVITAYLNDLENRLIGMNNTEGLEWKIVSNTVNASGWTDWSEKEPVVEGDSKLLIRKKARNIFAASEIVERNFTADNQPDTRKYIPIANLSLAGVSAEQLNQNGAAVNALDGNYNTRWLNSSAGTDTGKYIIVKFDTAVYLSAMDYVPHAENGKILGGKIEGSMDGENFTDIATISGWANNQNTKTIDFAEAVKVRYVKITGTDTNYTNPAKKHMGARMFNFYEDITKKEEAILPTAEVEYSNKELTNQDVVVTLVNENKDILVLNNGGNKTYTFTENGEFTFNFEDSDGNKGSAKAKVDWIYKTAPTAELVYSTTEETYDDVTVTINFPGNHEDNDITITNNDGNDTYTFRENGEFTFEFEDSLGNQGSATAEVTWIEKVIEKASIKYDITTKTNQNVTAFFDIGDEDLTIIGESLHIFTENGTFEFKYVDEHGNEQTAVATVDWIDKKVPTAQMSYSIMETTHQPVVVTVTFDKQNVTITNNDGKNTYTFTENGEFEFEFVDEAGNSGKVVATVDWIDTALPVATITYSTTSATNKDVVATIAFDKEGVTVKDGNTHTFTENGEYEFEFTANGMTGFAKAKVSWIDKVAPEPLVVYSRDIMSPTNEDITATVIFENEKDGEVRITNNGGKNTHVFTANGSFRFEFVDKAGNTGSIDVIVNCIDKTSPTGTVKYNISTKTNKDVVATLEANEGITITNNGGKNTYTFTKNGTFTFEFVDEAGNRGSVTAKVDWIDKTAPVAMITYSTRELTNKDVIATVSFDKDNITVDGGNTYTFKENGTYTFEYQDEVGNAGMIVAKVDWIDKTAPEGTISYNTRDVTNQDVIVTLTTNEEVTISNNAGKSSYMFTENGEFIFEFVDKAGNKGTATAKVDWIDKTAPIGTIDYNIKTTTSGEVIATLTANEEITIINNGGKNTYTFTKNDEFTFEFVDKAGNKGIAIAKVDWISKQIENKITLSYDNDTLTNQDVTVTLMSERPIVIVNNGGKNTYTFTENGEFTFEYVDEVGNSGSVTATVDWIDKTELIVDINYSVTSPTAGSVVATVNANKNLKILNNDGKNTYIFTENGEFTFEYVDLFGNTGSVTATVDWIDKTVPIAEVIYSTEKLTNSDVVVTLLNPDNKLTITNNNGSDTYTFTENGEFIFEYVDKVGNKGSTYVEVTWIDKEKPTAEIEYSTTNKTNKDVTVTIKPSEDVTILNNGSNATYVFVENGKFTFEYVDKAGNIGTTEVIVDWIKKNIISSEVKKDSEENIAVINSNKFTNVRQSQSSNSNDSTTTTSTPTKSEGITKKKTTNNDVEEEHTKEHQKKESNLIAIVVGIVIAVVGGFILLFIKRKNGKKENRS